jgi:hypothetical protein
MWEYLMEEQFFFKYNLKCSRDEFLSYPINERKWMIHRFLQQKDKEHEAMEKARKKKSH